MQRVVCLLDMVSVQSDGKGRDSDTGTLSLTAQALAFAPLATSATDAAIAYLLLQVGFDEEEAGLDAHHHGETAYAGEGRTADVAGRHPSVAQRVLLA